MPNESVLTEAQRDRFLVLVDEFGQDERIPADYSLRKTAGDDFRSHVDSSGVLDGAQLTREQLAEIIRIQGRTQNLQAIVLPQLLGTFPYYRFFKDFEGTEDDFSQHMASRRPNWQTGSVGYPGADLAEFSEDLRTLLSADGHDFALGLSRILAHPGVGRAFATGLAFLYRPDSRPLVNNASIAVFDKGGSIELSRSQRQELRAQAAHEFGVEKEVPKSRIRLLAWVSHFEALRSLGGFKDFIELDLLLWFASLKQRADKDDLASHADPVPLGGAENSGRVLESAERYLATIEDDQITARREAEDKAREIIASSLGHLTEEQVRDVFRLLNTDFSSGTQRINRFSPAFTGLQVNEAVAALDATNRWIERLWRADTDDELEAVLDEFWEANEISGAGRTLPTGILYLRDPERFSVLSPVLASGLAKLQGDDPIKGRTGARYHRYNLAVKRIREAMSFPPQAFDLVLWHASQFEGDVEPKPSGELRFSGFDTDVFRFLGDLRENNNDVWFKANRSRYAQMKTSLRDLVADLGQEFFSSLPFLIETEPKAPETLALIRKNIWGKQPENAYWPHYWAAFHRKGHSKNEDFQLYLALRPERFAYGISFDRAPAGELQQLARRIETHSALVEEVIRDSKELGIRFQRELEDGSAEVVPVDTAKQLAFATNEAGFVLAKEHSSGDPVVTTPALVDEVVRAFDAIFLLYLLAISEEPSTDIDAFRAARSGQKKPKPESDSELYPREQLQHETLLDERRIRTLEKLLLDKGQLILYGPPGTGKTWLGEKFARYFAGSSARVRVVQFHPSYSYEDFVEGIRPDLEGDQVRYSVRSGIFSRLCDEARTQPGMRYVLIVDEINRGNLPRIFGELLYLLERRGSPVELPGSGRKFSVPPNVYLIGTMNTADHSIALVDAALRRRFHFERFDPDADLLRSWLDRKGSSMVGVADVLSRLNERLEAMGVDRDQLIGHSHFMKSNLAEEELERIWTHSILPTIEEYFYGQPEKQNEFRYAAFVEAILSAVDEDEIEPDESP